MKRVDRSEILDLGEYEKVREHFRRRVMEEKKHRRLALGPHIMVLFENHDTVLLQIQEMLRTERITREGAILHEIETYNELLGGPNELGATVMVEIADPSERDAFLLRAKGLERHFVFLASGHEVRGQWDEARVLDDQASAVLYLRFALDEPTLSLLRSGAAELALVLDHPEVKARVPLTKAVSASLAEDVRA